MKVFTGPDCITQMINFIDRMTKLDRSIKGKPRPAKVFLYGHNAKGFDNYLVLEQKELKFHRIIHHNGIGSLTITGLKNSSITMRCTMSHVEGSLKQLCIAYNLPPQYSKSEMDHNSINAENYMDKRPEWEPYLKLDVVSLGLVWIGYLNAMKAIMSNADGKFISIKGCISSASLAFQEFMRTCDERDLKPLQQFESPYAKWFVR